MATSVTAVQLSSWGDLVPRSAVYMTGSQLDFSKKPRNALRLSQLALKAIDPNAKAPNGEDFLSFAVSCGNPRSFALLLKSRKFVNINQALASLQDGSKAPIFSKFIEYSQNPGAAIKSLIQDSTLDEEILTILIYFGLNINEVLPATTSLGVFHKTPLIALCEKSDATPDSIELLVKLGANINLQDAVEWTPLMYALESGVSLQVVRKILDLGADINHIEEMGKTPLMVAIDKKASLEVIKELIDRGADVNVVAAFGEHVDTFAAGHPESQQIIAMIANKREQLEQENQEN